MKIFRDPIHNVIDLDTGDKGVNGLITDLIDSSEFQRLRYIKQLGMTYFAYPSATHTRFEHSLGVAFLAKRFLGKVISLEERILNVNRDTEYHDLFMEFFKNIKKNKNQTIIAALLHDIGHCPLSHVAEDITGLNHEQVSREIILGDTDTGRILRDYDREYPQTICNILSNESFNEGPCGSIGDDLPSSRLISGQFDIDKIDYLLRDSHMTGTGYGRFDLEWLLNVLTVGIVGRDTKHIEIGLDLGKGLSIAEDFVMARIYMFRNVYFHKINLVAQSMLNMLIARINDLPHEAAAALFPNEGLRNVLLTRGKNSFNSLADYLSVSDIDLFYLMKVLRNSDDEVLERLSDGLLNRRLFKEVDVEHWEGIRDFVISKKGEGMEKYFMVRIELGDKRQKLTYQPNHDRIYLFDKNGKGRDILEMSAILPPNKNSYALPVSYYVDSDIVKKYIGGN